MTRAAITQKTTMLVKLLSPLTQAKVIKPARAGMIANEFLKGNLEPLSELISDRSIPVCYLNLIGEISELKKEAEQND